MLKRIVATATLVCVLPALANAALWSLNTWVKSGGGSMTSRNKTSQTSVNGTMFKSYTTSRSLPVTVTADAGYTISNITKNGVSLGAQTSPYTTTVSGFSAQSVYATFTPIPMVSLTATAGTGGTATPTSAGTIYAGQVFGSDFKFTFTPNSGYFVTAITGVPANATVSPAVPAATNTPVVVTFPAGTAVTTNITLKGTFSSLPIAKTGAPQTVMTGTPVTLNGSSSIGAITSYRWSQTSGPATVALTQPVSTTNATFTPTVAGTYTFKLTVTGGSTATTNVVVTNSSAVAAKNACVNCHNANGIGVTSNVYSNWSSSSHKSSLVMCATCHTGSNTGAHPGATVTAAACENCHSATLSPTTHPTATTASKCISCHDGHNPASGIADLQPTNHPAVTLYTFEEIGMQMAGGQKVPVQVDASGKGMPYSPKQTCGTAGCHVKNGVDYTYDKISDHAFHSAQGRNEYVDSSTGMFDATKTKPWTQSGAMVGKW